MIDQVMYLLGNVSATSTEYRKMLRKTVDLPKQILLILNKSQMIPKSFAFNYIYVLHNLTMSVEDVKSLTKLEVTNIVSIYAKLLVSTAGKDNLRD